MRRAGDLPGGGDLFSTVASEVTVDADGDRELPHPAHRPLGSNRASPRSLSWNRELPVPWLLHLADRRAQLRERAAQQARDVHLRDADAGGDLRLRQAFLEAHRDDLALALGEARRGRRASSMLASTCSNPRSSVGTSKPEAVRSSSPLGSVSAERAFSLWIASSTASGETSRNCASSAVVGRLAVLGAPLVDRGVDAHAQLLHGARHVHGPGAVAVVAPDLAHDRGCRVGRKLDAALGVVALDRLQQADPRDLDEVVERLAPVDVARGERTNQSAVAVHELLASAVVTPALPTLDRGSRRIGSFSDTGRGRQSSAFAVTIDGTRNGGREMRGPHTCPLSSGRNALSGGQEHLAARRG